MTVGRAFGWLAAALCAPLCAHAALEHAVSSTLTDALESATGEAVTVGDVDVSLFGALRLDNLEIGDVLEVGSVEARLSLAGLIGGRLETAEVVATAPHADLKSAGARLRRIIQRLGRRRPGRSESAEQPRQWPNVRVTRGVIRLDAGDRGSIVVADFSARRTASGLRLLTEAAEIHATFAGRPVTLSLGRSAADFNIDAARVERFIASEGALAWGEFASLRDVEVSYGVEGHGTLRLVGNVGDSGGRLSVRRRKGETDIALVSVPAPLLNPLLDNNRLTAGLVSGNLSIRDSRQRAALTGSMLLTQARGHLPWLLAEEMDLSAELAGSAVLDWSAGAVLTVGDLHIRRGPIALRLTGSLARPDRSISSLVGTVDLTMEPAPCSALTTALPSELVGPLAGMRLAGEMGAEVHLRVGDPAPRPVSLDVALTPGPCRLLADAPGADVAALVRGYTHLLPTGRRVSLGSADPGYVPLSALPSYVHSAFLVAEDGRFFEHRGFDHRQIESSIAKDLAVGRFARGGSTISQQLAKNLFLTRERTFGRKLQEAVLAWRIEATLGKRQILERYLNIIQLSDTVYGINDAAERWFGKSATRLSAREAAFLASLTRAPSTMTRVIGEQGGLTPAMVRRVESILRGMRDRGAIDASVLRDAERSRLELRALLATR